MKFKKIISAVLVFCLAASSVLSAAAYTVDENAFVDVNGNKRIDVGDALQTLQYSVGKFRKFSAQEKKVFYEGCVGYTGYGISSDDNDENVWFRDLKEEKAIPFMFENFKEKGGVPCFASDNEPCIIATTMRNTLPLTENFGMNPMSKTAATLIGIPFSPQPLQTKAAKKTLCRSSFRHSAPNMSA